MTAKGLTSGSGEAHSRQRRGSLAAAERLTRGSQQAHWWQQRHSIVVTASLGVWFVQLVSMGCLFVQLSHQANLCVCDMLQQQQMCRAPGSAQSSSAPAATPRRRPLSRARSAAA